MNESFELPAELTIYSALETRDALLAWVAQHSTRGTSLLKVSARQVETVDGSGLQLLASLSNMDLQWKLVDCSEAFARACATLGLSDWTTSVHGGGRP